VLATRSGGYLLRAGTAGIDIHRFEVLVAEGRRDLGAGDALSASVKLREALALWRGPALADLAVREFAQAEIRRLEEMRQSVIADRVDADLAQGKGAELVGELEALILANPLQERLRGQLMLALYRAGRQADALDAYRLARQTLNEELGLEPSRALQQLERAILLHDPSLDAAPRLSAEAGGELPGVQLCPFKGLAHFDIADSEYFFGRERLVGDLVARVVDSPLVGIVGPSGSGKSSILRAGLLASLSAGALPGSARWRVVLLRPGEHPLAELRRLLGGESLPDALAIVAPGERLLLAVDQLEELFTLCRDEADRAAFVASLTAAAADPERRAVVAVSLRADFYGHCAAYPGFADYLSRNHVLVGAMERDELARAIELPARRAGLEVERPLVDALVADIVSEPGGLPLLSATLLELWRLRQNSLLEFGSYRRSGGVRGAVARLAEDAYRRLTEDDRTLARAIMLRLAAGDGSVVVRKRVPVSDFSRTRGADGVLAELVRARLLTIGDDEVEVAHEAVLREWPRFTAWLAESLEERRFRAHLASSAREWEARERDPAELYRGARLASALDWNAVHSDELDELEREFIDCSRSAGERELRGQRQQNRRLRALLAGTAVILALALIAGALALIARSSADHSATIALADSLGAQAAADPHLDQAMLLGVAGAQLAPSEQAQGDLLTTLLRAPDAIRTYYGNGLRASGLALSPDGHTLALEDNFPSVFFLDTATGRRIREVPGLFNGPPSTLGYAPDGMLAFFGAPGTQNPSEVDFLNPATGRIVQRLPFPTNVTDFGRFQPGSGLPNFGGGDFAFADGGHRLAIAIGGYVVQWALPQGQLLRAPIAVPGSTGLVFYAAGGRQIVAVGSQSTSVLDATTGRVVRTYRAGGLVAALSPDGSAMVFGDAAGSVRFLDLRTGVVTQSTSAHRGGVRAVSFTPDGRTAITSGSDGRTSLWDVATHQVVRTLTGHAGAVTFQAISADGSTLYTTSDDGTAIAWDLTGKRSFGTTFRAAASNPAFGSWNVALSPDGRTLAMGTTGGMVNLWDVRAQREIESFRAVPGPVAAVFFGPGGRSLLVAGDTFGKSVHGSLAIWGLRPKPMLLRDLQAGLPSYTWATISPDGKTVAAIGPITLGGLTAAAHANGLVAEWNATTGKLLARPTVLHGGGDPTAVAFSARGTTVAISQLGNKAAVVDPAHRQILARWNGSPTAQYMLGAAISPDGTRVATTDLEGFLRIWDATTGKPVLPAIRASAGYVYSVAWSSDGSRLVTGGNDGTVRLYDARTGQQIGTSLPVPGAYLNGGPRSYLYVTFSPDGRTIVATDTAGNVWLYPATAAGWEAHACRLANRELTRAEWSQFLPGHPYRQVCGSAG